MRAIDVLEGHVYLFHPLSAKLEEIFTEDQLKIILGAMEEYAEEKSGVERVWVNTTVSCSLCSHSWNAVFLDTDCVRLECPNCENMTDIDYEDD